MRITIPDGLADYIRALHRTGLYGINEREVVLTLIRLGLTETQALRWAQSEMNTP